MRPWEFLLPRYAAFVLVPASWLYFKFKTKKKKRRDGGKARAPGVALLYVICFQKNAKADEASAVAPLTGGGIRCVKGKKNKIKEIR